ncbi:ABC transporter substrate-binding protein [Bacteroides congonensis]|uniref:fimbrillin family protein n=1 Tax=Bacteroides congonensis TaxID=1871006 RepID=UPI002674BD70|nr:ABC transporter substrate-binding protein [Bacteroides congonensis]
MKKTLLFFLAASCLLGCQQQDEQQEPGKKAFSFSASIDNESITDALTRSSSTLSLPAKSSFSDGDVISMSASEQDYLPFTIGMENPAWDAIDTDAEAVTFYAHYPELSDDVATRSFGSRYRGITGGKEYLFGMAQAAKGSKNVALKFKRMTVPVILLDEKRQLYEGNAIVKLFLKNKGVQDLFNGKIEVDKNTKPEYIDIRKISEGILTNLLPQRIKAGETIGTVIVDDKEEPIIVDEDIELTPDTPIAISLYRGRGIIDERTPLRR